MNPYLWFQTVFLLFILALFRFLFINVKRRRRMIQLIDKLPGPTSYPIIGSALSFSPDGETCTYQMEREFRTWTELASCNDKGLMRIWVGPKPILIVYRPETVRIILESQDLISKPMEYDVLKYWLGTGLLTSTGEKWHSRRKILTPAFHFSILSNFLQKINHECDYFIAEMDKKASDGYPFDFYKNIKNVALDIIGEAAMGIRLGIQQGANPAYCESARRLSEIMWLRMRSPWFWNQQLWYLSGYGAEADRHLKIVQGFTEKVIADRKKERRRIRKDSTSSRSSKNSEQEVWEQENFGTKARRQAFLDLLLEMQEENKLTDSDIREEVDTFMFEGHDTVSSAMGFTVYMVAHHPEIQDKIFEEIKEILESGDDAVKHEDINRMRYLEQCIRETLRMFPTVPMIGRVIQEEIEINGFLIPKGITAMVAPFAVHRDKNCYEKPDAFNPDNFVPEKVNARNPFAYIPFSAGPRNCIGQKFAMMEMKVVLSRFFLKFKAIPSVHELENRGLPELVLRPKKGCPIRIVKRPES